MPTATDSYSRADSPDVGTDWTQAKGDTGRHGVLSNQADTNGAVDCGDYYNAITPSADQFSQATITNVASLLQAVTVRSITTGTVRNRYNGGHDFNDTGNKRYRIYKYVAGVWTSLGAHATEDVTAGDVLRLDAVGTSQELKKGGVSKVAVTDASIASGQPGKYSVHGVANVSVFDDWSGGDISIPPPATTVFDDFLAWPARREVVLAEITPSITTLGTWTSGGSAGVYTTPLSRFYLTAVIPGGIYRRVVGVRQNAVDLPAAASSGALASGGGWYWDESGGVLWIRTVADTNPNTDTTIRAIQAFVTYYVATTGITLNRVDGNPDTGIYYHPWLSGELPRLSQHREDLLQPIKITEGGTLGFINANFWNHAIPDHNWAAKKARLFLGGSYNGVDLLRSEYEPLRTLLIDDITADEERATVALKPLLRKLERTIPVNVYTIADYPNAGEGVIGTRKWIGYGRTTMRPDLIDTTVSQGLYLIADPAYCTLAGAGVINAYAIHKTTRARTTLTITTDYTWHATNCTVTIVNAAYSWTTHEIEVKVEALPPDTFSTVVQDLLLQFCGVALADLDMTGFNQAGFDAPQHISVWIKELRLISSIIATDEPEKASLERGALGTVQQTRDGKWTAKVWAPTYSSSIALRKEDFASLRGEPRIETVHPRTTVYYDYDHQSEEWKMAASVNERNSYLWETPLDNDAAVYTFIGDSAGTAAADALLLAQRHQMLRDRVPLELEFVLNGTKLALASVGDVVLLTYDPLPVPGGAAVDAPFEIIRLDLSFTPTLTISGRLAALPTLPDW